MQTKNQYDPATRGTLLLVTDPLNDSPDVLEFASELAQSGGVHLELLHVIAPQTPTDERNSIRNRFTTLVRSLGSLQRNDEVILLFGNPEQVVSQRAEDIHATLVAVALNGSPSDRFQIRLAETLAHKCACPVVTLPPDSGSRSEKSFSTRECLVRFLLARQEPPQSRAS